MNKEEILAKSRQENGNRDIYEYEVMKQLSTHIVMVMLTLAMVFFITQMAVGGGMNWGLSALVLSVNMTTDWVKYIKLKQKNRLPYALAYTLLVAVASIYYIYDLINR